MTQDEVQKVRDEIRRLRAEAKALEQPLILEAQRIRTARKEQARRQAGLCPSCGKPKMGATTFRCQRCNTRATLRAAARRARQTGRPTEW